ncbi:hypothetical protein JXQ31_20830 [candidate division KSB1 bacterium]|nr:hypothetical protein [candidate division KSB1 bacterium]
MNVDIYCDGSCHVKKRLGAWAAFIYIEDEVYKISGVVRETTNQAMELTAVISSMQYLIEKNFAPEKITVFTDSQYVYRLPERCQVLEERNFSNRRGDKLPNWQMVKQLYKYLDKNNIRFHKIAAHQRPGTSLESDRLRAVDKLARQLVRKAVRNENV